MAFAGMDYIIVIRAFLLVSSVDRDAPVRSTDDDAGSATPDVPALARDHQGVALVTQEVSEVHLRDAAVLDDGEASQRLSGRKQAATRLRADRDTSPPSRCDLGRLRQ